ncbi:hypothetical protein ACFE04_027208 [Oxalis oulophora]
MDALTVDVSARKKDNINNGGGGGGGGGGGSLSHSNTLHSKHRRSKSASDRNMDDRRSIQYSMKKDQNVIHASPISTRAYRAQCPLYEHLANANKNPSTNHRASLEKDASIPYLVEQLQLKLQQEKSVRLTLEKAMGRVSSTLSPGHRHFAAQAKELIAEIELLEEEVANREQRVLSLYRSIFEQRVSLPPSEQNSGKNSPAHIKQTSRKHPSIISSAFCSSKMFPLRPLQALVSVNDSAKRTLKPTETPLSNDKPDVHLRKTISDTVKSQENIPALEKTTTLRTLKDHLYLCPSKLSEEMVRIMAAVYFWLRCAASENPHKNRSPLLSRSSTTVVLPRCGAGEDRDLSCKSMIEISWISTNKSHFPRASYAMDNYRVLVEQLEKVTVTQMENNAQIAFWINVYNALVMHAYLAYGIPQSSLRRLTLFHKAAYNIGGHIISAISIEQAVFCFRTPRIGRWLETILSTALRKKSGEERQLISSNSSEQLLKWVAENVDKKLCDSIQVCIDRKSNRKVSQIIEWLPYSSRFRYVFSKDLSEALEGINVFVKS